MFDHWWVRVITAYRATSAGVWFVLLLGVLSSGFWWAGSVLGSLEPLIGVNLPFSALQAVTPAIAAVIVATATGRLLALGRQLKLLPRQALPWALALTIPVMTVLLPGGGRWSAAGVDLVAVSALTVVYLLAAVCEEIGWTGLLLPMVARLNDLSAGLVIGALWSAWHIVGYAQAGNSPSWITGQCVFTIAFRVFLVRITRAGGGAVWPAVLGHAGYNVSWSITSSTVGGYDPWSTALAMAALTAVVFVVTRRTCPVPRPARFPGRHT